MARTNSSGSSVIISPRYCSPHPLRLKIAKKFFAITDGKFTVTNIETGEQVFKVDLSVVTIHHRRVLCDAAGCPIVTLYKKIRTMHERWEVFKGESTDDDDLIFSVRRSSMIQWGYINLDVFLANNKSEEVADFVVKVDKLLKRSCSVYARQGQSSQIIAQMKKGSSYMVTVHPNTDYAFIVALTVILDDIGHFDSLTSSTYKSVKMLYDPFDFTSIIVDLGLALCDEI